MTVPFPRPGPAEPAPAARRRSPTSPIGAAIVMGVALGALWVVLLADAVAGHRFDSYGIRPRELGGLWGILVAPFLHTSAAHLAGNTLEFLVLGWLVLVGRGNGRRFVVTTGLAVLASGLGVWLVGPAHSVTLGASGVVFGWLGYLLLRGVFNRSVWQIVLGVALLLAFGGTLWGLSPLVTSHVSWQGHLFGFAGGAAAAVLLAERRSTDRPAEASPTTPTIPPLPGQPPPSG